MGDPFSQSPVLFKTPKPIKSSIDLNLDRLYEDLMLHLKKEKTIPRQELKWLLSKVKQMAPGHHRSRWLLMKIKGLLKYILAKPGDFRSSLLKGEVTVYERTLSEMSSSGSSTVSEIPSSLLTNNDFMSMEVTPRDDHLNSFSQDLFSDNVESLKSYAQENYEMLKRLTQDDAAVEEVYKAHDSAEQTCSWLNVEMAEVPEKDALVSLEYEGNIDQEIDEAFDNLTVTDYDALKAEIQQEIVQTEQLILEIADGMMSIEVDHEEANKLLFQNKTGVDPAALTPSGELNFKIIQENCEQFKQKLAQSNKFDFVKNVAKLSNIEFK